MLPSTWAECAVSFKGRRVPTRNSDEVSDEAGYRQCTIPSRTLKKVRYERLGHRRRNEYDGISFSRIYSHVFSTNTGLERIHWKAGVP